jgi:hypothetical protein
MTLDCKVVNTVLAIFGAIIEKAVIEITRPAAGQNTHGASKAVAFGCAFGADSGVDSALTLISDRLGLRVVSKLF